MIARLDWKVVQAARHGAGGKEIGGLLLGKAKSGSPVHVSVDDFELIPCSYGHGSLYQLTAQDRERFARYLAGRSAADGREAVGFFRSHMRAGLSLDAGDLDFCTAHFRQPHHVVLLIRPVEGSASTAGFFFWERGLMRGESCYREFPFSQDQPAPAARNSGTKAHNARLAAQVGRCCIRVEFRPATVSLAEAAR